MKTIFDEIYLNFQNLNFDIKNKVINQKTKEEVIFELSHTIKHYLTRVQSLIEDVETFDKRDIIKSILSDDVFICTRVQEAWQAGTMTQSDFILAKDDADFINDLNDVL